MKPRGSIPSMAEMFERKTWALAARLSGAVRLSVAYVHAQSSKSWHSRIFTVPNQLTFLRLAFLPFFIIAIFYERYDVGAGDSHSRPGLSDGLDGLLARTLNQKTPLGAYLDPIADKLLLSSSFLVLAITGRFRGG